MIGEEIRFKPSELYIKNTVSFTEQEIQVLGIMLSSIDKDNVQIEVNLLVDFFEKQLNLSLESLIKLIKSIADKNIEVEKRSLNETFLVSIFSYIAYDCRKGIIKFKFNEFIDGFYLKLKFIYDKYRENNIEFMKGKYSWQTYEMLKTLEKNKKYYASIGYLKNLFNIKDQYKLYADFKRKVILLTQSEINEKTNLKFEFEEVKEQKKIIGINFYIYENERNIKQI
ncbi:MAG: replication initiation protein [Sarcina sp.]